MPEKEPRRAFESLIESFDSAMLVTRTVGGRLRSRPMQVVGNEGGGRLWFVTGKHAPKVDEIEAYPEVNVTMQARDSYLSISGSMRRHADPDRIREMWSQSWDAWFPRGKNDPDIVLLELVPTEAEYWNSVGAGSLRYRFDAGLATPEHAKVDL